LKNFLLLNIVDLDEGVLWHCVSKIVLYFSIYL